MSNWISVNDRLPDEDGEYLVFFNGEPSEMCVLNFATVLSNADEAWFAFENRNYSGWYDWDWAEREYYEVDGVTHWQPLPEPPKGE